MKSLKPALVMIVATIALVVGFYTHDIVLLGFSFVAYVTVLMHIWHDPYPSLRELNNLDDFETQRDLQVIYEQDDQERPE